MKMQKLQTMRTESGYKQKKCWWPHNLPTWCHRQCLWPCPVSLTSPSFMKISLLVLELRQFLFTRNWPKIRKSEISWSEFCPIPGAKLPYAAKCQVYSFYPFWDIKTKPARGGVKMHPPPSRLGLTYINLRWY